MTRAVHLELTSSLNTSDTLYAFRKFCGRRAVPELVISDNAATFKSISQKMFPMFGPNSPRWAFTTPRAPWRNGFPERLVRSSKAGLKGAIGLKRLSRIQLETESISVEFSINSRPMTRARDSVPLRPLDLLIPFGQMEGVGKEPSEQTLRGYLLSLQNNVSDLAAQWQDHYISFLPMLVPHHFSRGSLAVGDIVLLNNTDQTIKKSRLLWPLGRITELIPDRDGKIRSVVLKMATTILTRPIHLLVKLELSPHDWDVGIQTRSGRILEK